MFKFSLSVRTYHIGRIYGVPHWETWASISADTMRRTCLYAGERTLINRRGTKTAIELFRAAGLGLYQIQSYIPERSLDWIRHECERYDYQLHRTIE